MDEPSGLLIFAVSFGILLAFVLILWAINTLPGKVRAIMSSAPREPVQKAVPALVHVPVPRTGTDAPSDTPAEVVPADTTAEKPGTDYQVPRVSTSMSDRDIIVTLAVQRAGGKYRLSANQIYDLIGGSRREVLAIVKEVREGVGPEYNKLDADRQPVMN